MSITELRQKAKRRIDELPAKRIRLTLEFLDFLEEDKAPPNAATRELLAIPGFRAAFLRAKRQAERGPLTPIERLKRKY